MILTEAILSVNKNTSLKAYILSKYNKTNARVIYDTHNGRHKKLKEQ